MSDFNPNMVASFDKPFLGPLPRDKALWKKYESKLLDFAKLMGYDSIIRTGNYEPPSGILFQHPGEPPAEASKSYNDNLKHYEYQIEKITRLELSAWQMLQRICADNLEYERLVDEQQSRRDADPELPVKTVVHSLFVAIKAQIEKKPGTIAASLPHKQLNELKYPTSGTSLEKFNAFMDDVHRIRLRAERNGEPIGDGEAFNRIETVLKSGEHRELLLR